MIIINDFYCYYHIWLLLWYFSFLYILKSASSFGICHFAETVETFLLDEEVSHYSVLSGGKDACLLIVTHMMN